MLPVIRRALAVFGPACAVVLTACLPQDRVNASCVWREAGDALAPPGTRARRAHLVTDTRLAQDLGIRHADSVIGLPPRTMSDWQRAERRCTGLALQAAVRHHAADRVTRAELDGLVGARDWWFDLLAVFLPAGALFAAASRQVARRVAAAGEGDWRMAAVVLAVLTPMVAGMAVGLAQMWGWTAETLRLRNGHISYRAFQLPASRYGWFVAAVAAVAFAVVAALEVRRMRRRARHAPSGRARGPVGSVALGLGRRRS